jgi:hypothetical protein
MPRSRLIGRLRYAHLVSEYRHPWRVDDVETGYLRPNYVPIASRSRKLWRLRKSRRSAFEPGALPPAPSVIRSEFAPCQEGVLSPGQSKSSRAPKDSHAIPMGVATVCTSGLAPCPYGYQVGHTPTPPRPKKRRGGRCLRSGERRLHAGSRVESERPQIASRWLVFRLRLRVARFHARLDTGLAHTSARGAVA